MDKSIVRHPPLVTVGPLFRILYIVLYFLPFVTCHQLKYFVFNDVKIPLVKWRSMTMSAHFNDKDVEIYAIETGAHENTNCERNTLYQLSVGTKPLPHFNKQL